MKIILLHGTDTVKSYQRLTKFIEEAKKRNWEIVNDKIEETPSLFDIEKLIVVRNYKIVGKNELRLIETIPGTIVIYNESDIPATFVKTLGKNIANEKFDLPKLVWSFLDNINLKDFHKVIETEPIEFIFALISKHFKEMYWLKTDAKTMNVQSWQLGKIKKQADKYSLEELKEIIEKLSIIDSDVKTGKGDLLLSLDLLFAKHLK